MRESARAFYLHHEFMPLLNHPNRLFPAMATIEIGSQFDKPPYYAIIFFRTAYSTISAVLCRLSFCIRCVRWVSTV